ncbi:MAG: hypothetical protein IPH12_15830 [Saprospirales bacterium]|nr:hypothetical protein [Saprospirales bacterium]
MLSDKSADNNAVVAQYKAGKGLTMPAAGSDGGSLAAVQPYKNSQFGPFYGTPTFLIITPGSGEVIFNVMGNSPAATMDSIALKIAQLLLPACRIWTYPGDTLQEYGLKVQVPGGGAAFNYQVTGGEFSLEQFDGLPPVSYYEVTPSKTNDPLNGVSTFDLLQINKHILGIELFPAPWQLVAADANNSGTITTFDIVELRKLILGVYDSLPNAPSWVFAPPLDSISALECPEFFAIKKGDVNGNADAGNFRAGEDRTEQLWPLLLENKLLAAGQVYSMPVQTCRKGQFQGLQMAFQFDPAELELLAVSSAVLPDFTEANWHLSNGRLTVSWSSEKAAQAPADGELLRFRVLALRHSGPAQALVPEAAPLRTEVYDASGKVYRGGWLAAARSKAARLVQNPAREQVMLWLEDQALLNARIQLVNMQGLVMYEHPVGAAPDGQVLVIRPEGLAAGWYAVCAQGQILGKLLWLD